jgi:hypothetical protein
MADDFERRFRQQHAEVFRPNGTLSCRRGYAIAKMLVERRAETGAAWFVIQDLSRMSRNTIESLRLGELAADTGVRAIGASDGFASAGQQPLVDCGIMRSSVR